jgi:hypothetical protein
MELSDMIMDRRKFGVCLITLSATTFLFGCGRGNDAFIEADKNAIDRSLIARDPALAMVERFNMGSNLERMALQVAKSTHTYGMIAEKHGSANAELIVAQGIQKLIPEYQSRWNRNLATAYSSHLSRDELRSLATDGNQSAQVSRLLSVQSSVGVDMKNNSMPLLTELVTKALTNSIE